MVDVIINEKITTDEGESNITLSKEMEGELISTIYTIDWTPGLRYLSLLFHFGFELFFFWISYFDGSIGIDNPWDISYVYRKDYNGITMVFSGEWEKAIKCGVLSQLLWL